MSRAATLKDVLYGLEFDGQQLCRWPGGGKAWSLEPSGAKVLPHVADKALASGFVVNAPTSKFGESRYQWQGRAA
ncbi:MAG: hypothetical protein JWM16_6323 [Verrucomicrobiales bacterium]|nr:hypothetical protein [Verrucomicrobiales bacterium]